MNKSVFVVLALIVAGVIGILVYLSFTSSPENNNTDQTASGTQLVGSPESQQDNVMIGGDAAPPESARYLEYSQNSFAQASDKKRVYFFYAAWCPTCRPADAEFSSRSNEIPENVVLFRTNYDTENALKDKHNITYQHTFVLVDEQGNEVDKWNGGALDELISRTQ